MATVAICCANHCGATTNSPTDVGTPWSLHPGTYSITDHPGAPCTFYETRIPAGEYSICCGTCWGSGLFLARPSDSHLSTENAGSVNCASVNCDERGAGCAATSDCLAPAPPATYEPSGPMPCASVQEGDANNDAQARKTTTMALVSVVVDNYGTTYCNGKVLGVQYDPSSRLGPPETVLGAQEILTVVNPYGKYFLGPDNVFVAPNRDAGTHGTLPTLGRAKRLTTIT